jgi:hypothetical protein
LYPGKILRPVKVEEAQPLCVQRFPLLPGKRFHSYQWQEVPNLLASLGQEPLDDWETGMGIDSLQGVPATALNGYQGLITPFDVKHVSKKGGIEEGHIAGHHQGMPGRHGMQSAMDAPQRSLIRKAVADQAGRRMKLSVALVIASRHQHLGADLGQFLHSGLKQTAAIG